MHHSLAVKLNINVVLYIYMREVIMVFYKSKISYYIILVLSIIMLFFFGCVVPPDGGDGGDDSNEEIDYEIQVTYYPQSVSKGIDMPVKDKQPLIFKAPDPEKKFRIMEQNLGKFGRIIVKFKEDFEARDIDIENNPGHAKYHLYGEYNPITPRGSKLNFGVVTPYDIDSIDWREAIEYYDSLPEVLYAEPDYYVTVGGEMRTVKGYPNDPQFSNQWHLLLLNMPTVWDFEMGDPSVKVAVIDTGAAYTDDPDTPADNGLAPDLQNTSFDTASAWDYIHDDAIPYDDNSHGTHVAGTIAQSTDNSLGCSGMAPGITILPLKVVGANTSSGSNPNFNSYVASALERAADNDTDVINMSLIASGYSQTLQDACTYAYNAGAIIFACSGNNGSETVAYPSAYEHVISVGSIGPDKERATFSQYGLGDGDPDNHGLDMMAPGGDGVYYSNGVLQQTIIGYDSWTTDYTFIYRYQHGTSQASPHAAGLAALLKSYKPELTNDQIEQIMTDTAEDLGSTGVDIFYANGLISPVDAIVRATLMGIDETGETFEGKLTEDNETVEYPISVAGGEIMIELLTSESVKIELIGLGGEVEATDEDGYLTYDALAYSGEYTIRVSY
jgi:serine protease